METTYESFDARFDALIHPEGLLERLATGFVWAEGPVYIKNGDFILWSDIPNDRMLRYSDQDGMTVFRQPANYTNGHTLDQQGRLVSCEHGARRVTRTERDGAITVLADRFEGKKLNSPNDVVVKSDGTVWFTDPPYGILSDHEGHKADSEIGACYVYRLEPETGALTAVARDRDKPNGLAFNLDETRLYVSDTGRSHDPTSWHHIFAYDVIGGDALGPGRVFAEVNPGMSDGFRLDEHGHIFTSAGDGVHVYSPEGELFGKIILPETCSNVVFGGPERDQLYMTATTSLYRLRVNTRGAR